MPKCFEFKLKPVFEDDRWPVMLICLNKINARSSSLILQYAVIISAYIKLLNIIKGSIGRNLPSTWRRIESPQVNSPRGTFCEGRVNVVYKLGGNLVKIEGINARYHVLE